MIKKLSKYIAAFDNIDKTLIVLSAASGGTSIISFTKVTGIPARLAKASFTLVKSNKKKKKKHNKIFMLAESKLNSIEALMSQA